MIEVDGIYYSADEVEQALRERGELKRKVIDLKGALRWCGAAPAFQPGGEARIGWEKVAAQFLKDGTQDHQYKCDVCGNTHGQTCPKCEMCRSRIGNHLHTTL